MTTLRLAVFWTVLIVVLCTIPGRSMPTQFLPFSVDKWVHLGLFLVFGVLWLRARPGRVWAIFAVGAAFGIGIELWQGALPIGRSPDVLDAIADIVGLALGLGLGAWWSNDSTEAVSR